MTQWVPTPLTEKQFKGFLTICNVALHGVEYEENWQALGYSCPKKQKRGFLTSLFSSKKDSYEVKSKNELLREFLLDTIVYAGLDVLDIHPLLLQDYIQDNNLELKDEELSRGLARHYSYGYKKIKGVTPLFPLKSCLEKRYFSAHDSDKLEAILELIRASYTEVFLNIFKDF